MKKLLFGTAALALTGAAAQAGPALDAFTALLPPDAEVRFDAERVEAGAEVYEGLEVRVTGNRTQFEEARLSLASGVIGVYGQGVRSEDPTGSVTEADRVRFSGPLTLFELDRSPVLAGETYLDDELCQLLTAPLAMELSGVRLEEGVRVGTLGLTAEVAPVGGVCTLDFEQSLTGLEAVPPFGPGLRLEGQSLSGRAPVSIGLPETATGEVFSSELVLSGAEVTVDGAPQVRVGEVRSRSSFDADSALPLVDAGYNRHLGALTAGLAEGRAPEEQLPYADLWNGGRALSTEGTVRVTGLEVVGPALAPLSPVPGLLEPGARLDAELTLTKEAELIKLLLRLDGSNTALIDLSGSVRVEEADPSFNAVSPRALLMSAPLSFVSGSARLSDRGVGAAGTQLLGSDPYLMIAPALAGLIGAANAESLSDWLAAAKDGGEARISADPAQPVPVLMLGMMGLGDWSALGAMLNVTR